MISPGVLSPTRLDTCPRGPPDLNADEAGLEIEALCRVVN